MAKVTSQNPIVDSGIKGLQIEKGPPVADLAIAPPKPSTKDVMQEWGSTGTIMVGGILSNVDYNNELTGTQRVQIYDEMVKGDATVRAATIAVKLPIKSANWYVKEYSQDAKDIEIKEFIEEQLFNQMSITWSNFLNQCLKHLDYGSMVFEKVYKMLPDGKIGWDKFAPRLTKTIYRWRMPDNITEGITQIIPTGGLRGIPAWKLLMFVNEQEGENYEGLSILRSAYKHWYMKESYYKIDGVATERQGLGIPYVKVPPNASDADRAKMDEILRNMRANEAANVQIPMGWELGFLDMKSGGTKNSKDMILHHDRQIVKSVLAQFLELGSGETGSFALSANQSELFLLSLKAITTNIREVINMCAIRELVDLNFKVEEGHYPTLEVTKIGQVDFDKLSVALYRLSQGGLITASPELEQYLRNAMDLPEAVQLSEDDNADPDDKTLPVPKEQPVKPDGNQEDNKKQGNKSADMTQQIESKKASELETINTVLGHEKDYDINQLRREIEEAIHAKQS